MSFITNPSQLAPPPPRRLTPAGNIPGLNSMDGSPAKLTVRALNAYEFGQYQASLRNDDGNMTNETYSHSNLKFLAVTICDAKGNLLWQTVKDAVEQLGKYEQYTIDALFAAAVKGNAADAKAVDKAEKGSEATESASSSGTSASTSEHQILVS